MGTSRVNNGISCNTWDHPHACGDKLEGCCYDTSCVGSSPRVWGQVPLLLSLCSTSRIIPTRVGTRERMRRYFINGKDHPHACGDKAGSGCTVFKVRGSSPRVWGQVQNHLIFFQSPRIIPTRVGTSDVTDCRIQSRKDHPHACGDKLYLQIV